MNLLEKISRCPAPAGSEQKMIELLSGYLTEAGCNVMADSHKNLIAHKAGLGKPIIIMAPLDTPCLYITHVDEKGFLRFRVAGDIDKKLLIGRAVTFKNGADGIIMAERGKDDIENMFIDIGAKSVEEAEKTAGVSDYAAIKSDYISLGDFACGPFMGGRAALCAALTAAACDSLRNVYFVFAAKTSISQHSPSFLKKIGEECEMLISIEKSHANDCLGEEYTALKLGGGPSIRMRDRGMVSSAAVLSFLTRHANGIKTQKEVAQNTGIAAVVQKAYGGIWAGSLGIPTRYSGGLYEVVCTGDIENLTEIIKNCLNSSNNL